MTSYIREESLKRCDEQVVISIKEALADIVACTIAGSRTEIAGIVKRFALEQWGRGKSSIFLSPDRLQATGAALVNATMANALDIDDGHRLVKGHPGAVIFPAILAAAEEYEASGEEFLAALLVGYEIGIRAGILAHQLRPEYHCTGSWGAIGAAAGVARIIGLSDSQIENALGIAEYHSTYSPMMRCIDHPSMLKDGISWGSMAGISSAYLAKQNFTGIPSLLSFQEASVLVNELGNQYRIQHLYYKPHACCRWAQPAVEGAKYLMEHHHISHHMIERIVIRTFRESARLSKKAPANTEEAQYNLYFPVAAYLVFGEMGPAQALNELANQEVLRLMDKMETTIDPDLNDVFPEKALCQVEIHTANRECFISPVTQARGDFDFPLTSEEKKKKFFWLTEPILGKVESEKLFSLIHHADKLPHIGELTAVIAKAIKE